MADRTLPPTIAGPIVAFAAAVYRYAKCCPEFLAERARAMNAARLELDTAILDSLGPQADTVTCRGCDLERGGSCADLGAWIACPDLPFPRTACSAYRPKPEAA